MEQGSSSHIVEVAKSGRATCRACREGIPKGALRFGEAALNAYSDSGGMMFLWFHLECAAKKKPNSLREALATFEGEVPNRTELEELIESNADKEKPTTFPYLERAPTGRARCAECRTEIEKGSLRIAFAEGGHLAAGMDVVTRYLHPKCTGDRWNKEELLAQLRKNSRGLTENDFHNISEMD